MRIGTMFLGTVESLGSESIQTKFFVLGVPLFPVSSHYVLREQGANRINGFEIPIHGKSVGLAYLRTASWLVAIVAGIFYYIDGRHSWDRHSDMLGWAIGAGIVAILSTFVLGRLTGSEKVRRGMLQRMTGFGAPPELLPADVRAEIANKLLAGWKAEHDSRAWDREIENGNGDPRLFALAEYHGRPDLARTALANIGRTPTAADGPYR